MVAQNNVPPNSPAGPYAIGVPAYLDQGWDGVIPLRPDGKIPYLKDVTGRDGRQVTPEDSLRIADRLPYCKGNLGLRLPKGIIGIDVDEYDDKHGYSITIVELTEKLGPLPFGPYSTSRGPGVSGIWLFHLPGEYRELKDVAGADVEVIQWHHRYNQTWPSVHPRTGATYQWYAADGTPLERPPRPEELPTLPPSWADYLTRQERVSRPYAPPVDKETGEILEGFQGTPEGLERRFQLRLQEIRNEPTNGRGEQWINDIALEFGHYVPCYLHEDDVVRRITEATATWTTWPDGGRDKVLKGVETGLRDGMADPRNWEERRTRVTEQGAGVKYFARIDGDRTFLAASLATDILDIGPLAAGLDSLLWEYRNGVWVPSKDVARHRAAFLLGENYRRSFATNAEDIVRSRVPEIECEPTPEVINFRNGLYYWQTGRLEPHTPDVLSTVQLSVDWDETATCPEFDTFLGQVVPPDMVGMVWELVGYLMHSGNPLHKAVMLTGTGRNGKGTFLRTVEALLGKQNITSASLIDLVNTRFTTASLFGKIANIAGDIDGTYLENTATFKAITGQDMISAEHKGRDRFDFTPWAVPVFSANKIPGSADTTVGYLSRWVVLHFPHDFTGREDRTLDQRLQAKAELAGIAVKAVAALKTLMARRDFELPPSAQEARKEFIRRVDQVHTWISECTDIAPDHPWVNRTALYATYKQWATRDKHGVLKATEFYDRLEAADVRPAKVHGARGFVGIKVTDTAEGYGHPR